MDISPSRLMPPPAARTDPAPLGGLREAALPQLVEPVMSARVLAAHPASGGGWILELDLGGETVDARSRLALPIGTRLSLQLLSPERARVGQMLPARDATPMLARALRAMLPVQMPLHQALASLAAAARSPALPQPLAERLRELLARTPSAQHLGSGAGLRAAMLDSGGFLEARLHRLASVDNAAPEHDRPAHKALIAPARDADSGATGLRSTRARGAPGLLASLRTLLGTLRSPLPAPAPGTTAPGTGAAGAEPAAATITNDLKARLFGILAELASSKNASLPTRAATAAARSPASPAPSLYGPRGQLAAPSVPLLPEAGAQHKHAALRAASTDGEESVRAAELIAQILRTVQAALARTRVHQIASHPDSPRQPENPPVHAWSVELPIARGDGFDTLELQIEDHDESADTPDARQRRWQVQLSLQLEAMGTLHARLVLNGQRLATTLWLADPQAFARARSTLSELGDSLRAQGVELSRLDCLEGAPPRTPASAPLIELSS